MPVEIKELVIRAVVDDNQEKPLPAATSTLDTEERKALVDAAVREVLRILRTSKER